MKEQKEIKTLDMGKGVSGTIESIDEDKDNIIITFFPTRYKIPKKLFNQDLKKLVGKRVSIANFGPYNNNGTIKLKVLN